MKRTSARDRDPARAPQIPLRERNLARVRRAILEACLASTRERSFSELSVREICERAAVSPGTFFNHFPTKEDVLLYHARIWTIGAALQVHRERARGATARAALGALLKFAAREQQRHPRFTLEGLSAIVSARASPQVGLTKGERLLWFGDAPEVEEIEVGSIDELLSDGIEAAVREGELPPGTSVRVAARALQAAFYGVPTATRADGLEAVARGYEEALAVLWAGLTALGQERERTR